VTDGQLQTFHLPAELTQAFYQDRQGRLWASNKADDVFLWKDGQAVRLSSRELPSTTALSPPQGQGSGLFPQSLAWNRLVFEDREGNAWLGTYDKGLLKLVEQSISFLALPGSTRERYVYPLLEDRAGQIWISAGEAGLMRYANGQFTRYPLAGVTGATDLSSLY
jgi:ligand-binding sensor domain-containing protein